MRVMRFIGVKVRFERKADIYQNKQMSVIHVVNTDKQ